MHATEVHPALEDPRAQAGRIQRLVEGTLFVAVWIALGFALPRDRTSPSWWVCP